MGVLGKFVLLLDLANDFAYNPVTTCVPRMKQDQDEDEPVLVTFGDMYVLNFCKCIYEYTK